jgi:monoamine oxidase
VARIEVDDNRFIARAVIVTVPLAVLQARHVTFDPPLTGIESAIEKLVMGGVLRLALRFDEAFWATPRFMARHGDTKMLTFLQTPLAVDFPVWWTTYPVEAPVLVGWRGGPGAWNLSGKSDDELRELAITSLAKVFRMSRTAIARRVRACFMHNWMTDPFAMGAYSYVGIGGSRAAAILARPVERTIFFAGEHASSGRNGTVDGAIASGRRAADQVLRLVR